MCRRGECHGLGPPKARCTARRLAPRAAAGRLRPRWPPEGKAGVVPRLRRLSAAERPGRRPGLPTFPSRADPTGFLFSFRGGGDRCACFRVGPATRTAAGAFADFSAGVFAVGQARESGGSRAGPGAPPSTSSPAVKPIADFFPSAKAWCNHPRLPKLGFCDAQPEFRASAERAVGAAKDRFVRGQG